MWCKDHDKIDRTNLWDGATILETNLDIFKWKQYEAAIILLTVRWYLKYSISYQDLVEMMSERGSHELWRGFHAK
ncbi:MAG: transposase [Bacilli bacterium]|nr:transposase [Bacilli bacterium]